MTTNSNDLLIDLIELLKLDYGHLHFWRMNKVQKEHHYLLTAQTIDLMFRDLTKEKDKTIERLRRNNQTFADAAIGKDKTS